jgi:hypothetical protein
MLHKNEISFFFSNEIHNNVSSIAIINQFV